MILLNTAASGVLVFEIFFSCIVIQTVILHLNFQYLSMPFSILSSWCYEVIIKTRARSCKVNNCKKKRMNFWKGLKQVQVTRGLLDMTASLNVVRPTMPREYEIFSVFEPLNQLLGSCVYHWRRSELLHSRPHDCYFEADTVAWDGKNLVCLFSLRWSALHGNSCNVCNKDTRLFGNNLPDWGCRTRLTGCAYAIVQLRWL